LTTTAGKEVSNVLKPDGQKPQEIRAEKRRAEWEAERLAEVRQQLEDGLITEEEAKERGA
jgi:hypothetical protein